MQAGTIIPHNAFCGFNTKMHIDLLSNPGDIYSDHDVSCDDIVGIKHQHNIVRDTLVDICFRSEILAGSSPLTQTGMIDFVPGRAMIEVAQRKRVKYEAKCANIEYGFPFLLFSSFGKLENDVVTLLKRIRKFSMTQDIGARTVVHIFSRINFVIDRGVGAHVLWWLNMVVVRFHFSFVGLSGCHDGGGKGLTKTSLITHIRDRNCNGNAQAITRQYLSTNLASFEEVGVTFKRMVFGYARVVSRRTTFVLSVDMAMVLISCHPMIVVMVLLGGSLQLMRETLAKFFPPLSGVDEEDLIWVRGISSSTKHLFKHAPSLPHIPINHHQLIASQDVVLNRIKSFPRGTSCGRDGLRAQHFMDCLIGAAVTIFDELVPSITQVVNLFLEGKFPNMLGEYIACAPLTPLVELGGGIRSIAVGTIWRRLVFKVSAVMIGHSLDGYLDGLQFGVGVSGWGEAILYSVNHLIECRGDDVGLSMLLVDYKNAFNLVDQEVWYLDDDTIIGDTLVVGKVLELIMRMDLVVACISTLIKLRAKLLGGSASVDLDFSNKLVMKRVTKTIVLMDTVERINDPQFKLPLLRAYLRYALELIITTSGPGFGDVLNYAFLASRLQCASLQTKLLRHSSIVAYGSTFDDTLCVFNTKMKTSPLSNPSCGFGLDSRRDVCVDLIGSSPLTQIEMVDFVPGCAMIDTIHCKRVKYETECPDIRYGFLPFSFYSLEELENAVMALLKRIHKFSMTQDIGACAAAHILIGLASP
uniref:Reverse transcriptase domain-containing protein n=1 Tax=Tanacetum cinerariifolium TaxID=118510 RepID=A0A6L2ND62_TANCI|nr:hypothetical protein [Tanacetum cinerariifolium]